MIIPVRLAGDGLDGDWALMELQGLLERGEEESFRNMNIGDLTFEGVRGETTWRARGLENACTATTTCGLRSTAERGEEAAADGGRPGWSGVEDLRKPDDGATATWDSSHPCGPSLS